MLTIAVSNEKGGVAKTTTTLSLGASLSETGANVLLIDLDAQANLTLALGIELEKHQSSTSNVLLDRVSIAQAIQKTEFNNLHILPANSEMGEVDFHLFEQPNYTSILRKILHGSPLNYDYILLDCPPALSPVTKNSLVAADILLIPTQPEFFSIYGLRNLMGLIQQVRNQWNPRLAYRLLLTMCDGRNKTHRILSEQLRETFGTGVMEAVIMTDTKIRESSAAGIPIIYYAPKSRAALQYRALAQEMITYVQKTTLQPAQ
jgi:chromosome partitioning protein